MIDVEWRSGQARAVRGSLEYALSYLKRAAPLYPPQRATDVVNKVAS